MSDTSSPLLQLLLMGDGLHAADWGDRTNDNLTKLENAIAGTGTIDMVNEAVVGVVTLSQTEARNAFLTLTGALTGPVTLVVPAVPKMWFLSNKTTGGFVVTMQTAAPGLSFIVPPALRRAIYTDGTDVFTATSDTIPVGTVEESYALTLPSSSYQYADGTAINRTAFASLLNAITATTGITGASGTGVSTPLQTNSDLSAYGGTASLVGAVVEGAGIPSNTTVVSYTSTTLTLSQNTTGATTASPIRIFPNGNGDGATTFNKPDRRQRVAISSGTMNGVADPNIVPGANAIGQKGGEAVHALTVAELAVHSHPVNDPSHSHGLNDPSHLHGFTTSNFSNTPAAPGSSGVNAGFAGASTNSATTGISVQGRTTGISLQNTGSGTGHNNVQPYIVCNHIIRVS